MWFVSVLRVGELKELEKKKEKGCIGRLWKNTALEIVASPQMSFFCIFLLRRFVYLFSFSSIYFYLFFRSRPSSRERRFRRWILSSAESKFFHLKKRG